MGKRYVRNSSVREEEEEVEEEEDCVSFKLYNRLKATAIPSFSWYTASPYVTLSLSLISPTLPIFGRPSVLFVLPRR